MAYCCPIKQQLLNTVTFCCKTSESVLLPERAIASTVNGSNTFGTIKICSRQREFEQMNVNQTARSGGIIGISLRLSYT